MVPFQALQVLGHAWSMRFARTETSGPEDQHRRSRLRGGPDLLGRSASTTSHSTPPSRRCARRTTTRWYCQAAGRQNTCASTGASSSSCATSPSPVSPSLRFCQRGPILAAADAARGRVVSCYPACAPELRAAGGEYSDIPSTRRPWTQTSSPRRPGLLTRLGCRASRACSGRRSPPEVRHRRGRYRRASPARKSRPAAHPSFGRMAPSFTFWSRALLPGARGRPGRTACARAPARWCRPG